MANDPGALEYNMNQMNNTWRILPSREWRMILELEQNTMARLETCSYENSAYASALVCGFVRLFAGFFRALK